MSIPPQRRHDVCGRVGRLDADELPGAFKEIVCGKQEMARPARRVENVDVAELDRLALFDGRVDKQGQVVDQG